MKRIIPVLLVLLLLAGCARTPLPPDTPEQTREPEARNETAAPEQTPETETAPGTALPEEDDEMKKGTVTLDGLNSYLRLKLPEGWTWAVEEPGFGERSILLSAPTDDGFRIRLVFWETFGLCGTGVDFSEYTLPDGRKATLATEGGPDEVTWTLILPESPDQFTVQFVAPRSVMDVHQAELDAMLGSLRLGALSQIPPQPTQRLADK